MHNLYHVFSFLSSWSLIAMKLYHPSPHAVWKYSKNFNAVGKFVMDIVVFGEKMVCI